MVNGGSRKVKFKFCPMGEWAVFGLFQQRAVYENGCSRGRTQEA